MLEGFKDFLLRGNVVDLAVAVIIGTAFVAVVTAFSNGVINPLLAVFGGINDLGLGFQLVAGKPATFVAIGPIITAALDFLIIAALLYFILVIPATKAKERWGNVDASLTDNELLHQIRDLLAEDRIGSSGGKHES
ncbi:large conductance mechanosensitive channel protein MscL [Nocardia sp. SYP-A9097]|uniref:large conductance mechanosensitive channel protein MscL n=1 Tax=Nocardia sp. SYP-A9097 TaxID=2663237 RepID=UPI00129BB0CA|nr:large conductance mechanosensitive channel protein MscL [Nocardia sp. SYP-A9097]MRH86890.1 large conductance mechanosensitive channel protein MscL [Nocardia sp. SYP-A9097]